MIRKLGIATILLLAFAAAASSIKVWSSGETLRASDLNAALAHLHATMVGGHGARLVDADVSASAAITHSKLATPALLPKAWARVTACNCNAAAGTACTITASSRVTSVKSTGADNFCKVELAYTPANTAFMVIVNGVDGAAVGQSPGICTAHSYATANPQFQFHCTKNDGTDMSNAADIINFVVFDNDN